MEPMLRDHADADHVDGVLYSAFIGHVGQRDHLAVGLYNCNHIEHKKKLSNVCSWECSK